MSAVLEKITPSAAPPAVTEERFVFTASGSEYFRIWIVNLLLTIVTLGVYSAWAKVRTHQYFYSNIRLAGSSFEYHGNPLAILKGLLIGVALLGGYQLALHLSPVAGFAMMGVMAALLPWLLWKSLQFALHNSSFRGIRFGFRGSLGGAYLNYLVLPIASVFTLGLLYPFVHQRIKRFQHTESRYGDTFFSFDAKVGAFYKAYGHLIVLQIGGGIALGIAGAILGALLGWAGLGAKAGMIVPFILIYPYMLCVTWAFMAVIQNLIWNHTQLGPHRFVSTMTWQGLMKLYVTNTLGMIFTLGLYIPFAHVRMVKYRLECTTLLVAGSLDDVSAVKGGEVGALGDGVVDLAGIDLSL
ncbi:YjgN family protein [Pseudoduganella armeniaca]|uniref:DUF898 domain-containing protein n=1 Tax=Pseudoduganella armeniaca TaxID=2072590 RepID=A0A2R4C6J3_9BURK|nr:YjgN family protein [Pseudoduganella armeniaca]AVR95229.1 DUF898 domain-containing protein [Pseudoduganella armeniaca]